MACIIRTSNVDLSVSLPSPLKLSGAVSLSEPLPAPGVFSTHVEYSLLEGILWGARNDLDFRFFVLFLFF